MRTVSLLVFTMAFAHCGDGGQGPTGVAGPVPVTRLRTEPYSFSYNSGFTERQRLVIRDAAAWRAAWATLFRGHSPQPELPAVDFEREMVVVVAMGERPTGGHSIFVDSASAGSGGVAVRIRSVSPGPNCGTTQALTQPVDVARLPRRDGDVTFTERMEIDECR